MAFPNPPTDGQVYDHPNGLEYVYSDATHSYTRQELTQVAYLINGTNYRLPTCS